MTATPACPRCGYDQSGAIAAWERSEPPACPLEGVCSECGLEFAWRDVLNPRFHDLARFFERARNRLVAAFFTTWLRALRPRRFWSWIRMEHPTRAGRMALVVAIGVALVAAIAAAFVAAITPWLELMARFLPPRYYQTTGWSDIFWNSRLVGGDLYFTKRGNGDPAPWVVIAVGAALCMPLAFVLLPVTLRRARVRRGHIVRVWAYGLIWLPLVLAAPALVFALVPMGVMLDVRLHGAGYWCRGLGVWLYRFSSLPGLACAAAWIFLWWKAAAGRYMRLPRPALIAGAMLLLTILLVVGVLTVIPGGAMWLVWDE
jgi:hypothetical protein